ncbi:uncharacterized protein PGTG_16968 [Puccinia graminis f. sp. tritici CRL 75-36-700-3]|uniref:Uncharacterized protein n=1 Tax=Puccinia graminis f. sp. tritici (strain CRL 75-36-700-3 / race SCCL) TaxID=418459 RepID=E3L3I1_PUCGT|nr:uncharacterized protein PGTG_16968 [Puccinia graminis f. sp. tritici CRL 75-36-700-3]EFP91106.1 hypothetical protein PGTG_16968 [Puccinia graminis f. sp. tritici CRL 75-36-700-3]
MSGDDFKAGWMSGWRFLPSVLPLSLTGHHPLRGATRQSLIQTWTGREGSGLSEVGRLYVCAHSQADRTPHQPAVFTEILMSAGGFAAARPGHISKIPSVHIRKPTGPRPVRATVGLSHGLGPQDPFL